MYQITGVASAELEIKKSRFIASLHPVQDRSEARTVLASLRSQHPGAVHVCWALVCSGDSGLDDDGEPSGTAAKPMYNVLVHKDVNNILAAVVRYWGGIKLGAGGLTRAYGQAVSEAFKNAVLVPVEAMCERYFQLQFANESSLRRFCEQWEVQVINASYEELVTLHVRMKASIADEFEAKAHDLLRGDLICKKC